AVAGGGAERVGVIDQPAPHDRHGLEPAVRVLREAGDHLAVIHAPAVLAGEVLADGAPCERRRGAEPLVARGVGVVVVDAEQEGIGGGPRGPRERLYVADDVLHGEPVSRLWAAERNPAPASTTTEGWPLGSAAATIAACARR